MSTRHLYLHTGKVTADFLVLNQEKVFHKTLPHMSVYLSSMAFTKLHVKYNIRLNNHTLRCRVEKTVILNFLTNYQCQKRKPYKRHLLLFESQRTRGSCHVRTNKPTTLPTKPTHFLPYSHLYRPHSCISRALTFAYIFFKKKFHVFSKGQKNLFGKKGAAYTRVSTVNKKSTSAIIDVLRLLFICN